MFFCFFYRGLRVIWGFLFFLSHYLKGCGRQDNISAFTITASGLSFKYLVNNYNLQQFM